jgi:TolB-like protein
MLKGFKPHAIVIVLMVVLLIPISAASKPTKTLAIFPFENNSVTDPQKYKPLCNGLSAMLITDLQKAATDFKVVERQKIKAVLQEIALGQSGVVDQATAIKAGKILGAQTIAFGSFMVLGDQVRMDVRVIFTETSETILGDSVTGDSDEFMKLERELAGKIASAMDTISMPTETSPAGGGSSETAVGEVGGAGEETSVSDDGGTSSPAESTEPSPADDSSVTVASNQTTEPAPKSDIDAALYFSKGLDALDRGDMDEADKMFDKCIELDPAYKVQVDNAKGLL